MAKKAKAGEAAKVEEKKAKRRYVAAGRVEQRESEGWKRVSGKGSVLPNGSVLMEKAV